MAKDKSSGVNMTVRVSVEIQSQIGECAGANGIATAEQARHLLLAGLAAEQQKLIAAGRLPAASAVRGDIDGQKFDES